MVPTLMELTILMGELDIEQGNLKFKKKNK